MARFLHGGKPGVPARIDLGRDGDGGFPGYLGSLKEGLRLDPRVEGEVVRELYSHLCDKAEDLEAAGVPPDQARAEAARFLGPPRLLAKQLYEAHSQCSWRQTALTALPHLIFALLFALNWWRSLLWLLVTLGAVIGFSSYGWWRGKPGWLFPWLGYLQVPVVFAGLLLLYLPRAWSWLAVICYVPFALWLVVRLGKHTLRRDWMYVSLMVLPVPVLASWLLALEWNGPLSLDSPPVSALAPRIAASFIALAAAAAIFMRLRQRRLKIGCLLAWESSILVLVALSSHGFAVWEWALLMLASAAFLLAPALLERMAGGHRAQWEKAPLEQGLSSTRP